MHFNNFLYFITFVIKRVTKSVHINENVYKLGKYTQNKNGCSKIFYMNVNCNGKKY